MSYSSGRDAARPSAYGAPDPFASLVTVSARRRFWLIELLMAPFIDHDERVSYRLHKEHSEAKNGNGANGYAAPGGAGNGNGNGNGANGFVPAPNGHDNGHGNGLFNPGDRRPSGA